MKSNLIDLTVYLHVDSAPHEENQGAVLISDDGSDDNATWVPKSLIEMQHVENQIYVITLPENIAIEKGLI